VNFAIATLVEADEYNSTGNTAARAEFSKADEVNLKWLTLQTRLLNFT